jgi:hypothetical protein
VNSISLKIPEDLEFDTFISEDATSKKSGDSMIVKGTLRAIEASMQTRDRNLQLPRLEAGHADLRISEKGDIQMNSFAGRNINGNKGSLTAASEKGNITIRGIDDANDVKLEIKTEGSIMTGPTNANTACFITGRGDIMSEALLSPLSLLCKTEKGDVAGDYGFPSQEASLHTKQGRIEAGIVGDSRTGSSFQLTNDRGDVDVELIPKSGTGAVSISEAHWRSFVLREILISTGITDHDMPR